MRERKYEEIAAELEKRIRSREPADPTTFASERELTDQYGVDRSTIRRALSVLETKGLILRQPGRRTAVLARDVGIARPRRGRQIALLLNASPRGWATLPVLHGAEAVFTARGYDLALYSTHADDPDSAERRERDRLEHCLERRVAGVILWPAGRNEEALHRIDRAGIPIVLLDQKISGPSMDFVGIDNVAAAYRATEHLLRLGHRRIAHLTRENTQPTTLQRLAGYRRAMVDYGARIEDAWAMRCRPGRAEEEAVEACLRVPDPPTAIFAINDMTALRVMHYLARRGIRVPDQVAVVGVDDLPVAELTPIRLTTVRQPFEQMGAAAAELLLDRIEHGASRPVETRLLPTRLVVRASCGGRRVEAARAEG